METNVNSELYPVRMIVAFFFTRCREKILCYLAFLQVTALRPGLRCCVMCTAAEGSILLDCLQTSPLYAAAEGGHDNVVKLLIEHKAVVNFFDPV
jgi:ankyrin repeat protein